MPDTHGIMIAIDLESAMAMSALEGYMNEIDDWCPQSGCLAHATHCGGGVSGGGVSGGGISGGGVSGGGVNEGHHGCCIH